jgi:hypothetical protein
MKKHETNRHGFSVLIILLLMSMIIFLASNFVRSTIFLVDISMEREEYERRYQATIGLLNYGIAMIYQSGEQFFFPSDNQEITITFQSWPLGIQNPYQAQLTIKPDETLEGAVVITADLFKQGQSCCNITKTISNQR